MLRNPTKPAGHAVCRIRIYRETSRLKWWFCQPPKCIRVVLGNTVKSTGKVRWDICSMRPFVQYWHTPGMQVFRYWGTSRPEHPSCGGKSGCSIATANQIGWIQIYQMERCSKPLCCYVSPTATSGDAKIESAWCVPGWGHQISRHFRWCQVIWPLPWDFNCPKSSSIGKTVQAWLAHRVPVRLSNSSSIVNEQSSCACKVGNLSDGALLRTASLTLTKLDTLLTEFPCPISWRLYWHRQV